MTTATLPRPTTVPRPTTLPGPVVLDAPTLREAPARSWSPYDAPVYQGSASTLTDKLVHAATLVVSYPASVIASVVGACGLAIGTPIVLASEQRQERRHRAQLGR
jgi:hypothetical protein